MESKGLQKGAIVVLFECLTSKAKLIIESLCRERLETVNVPRTCSYFLFLSEMYIYFLI